ncbi:hypothetical protein IH992_17050 [Candidatus Poribacteria bacterium]|nr:hypothetical protein [Candidatus Poribacteria bacterium]
MLYREKSSWSAVIGAMLALVGVTLTLWLQSDMPKEMMEQGNMSGGAIALCGIGIGFFGDLRAVSHEEDAEIPTKSEDKSKVFTGV